MSIRSLTGFPREKVKVLMVLYDGGKHAEEVSLSQYFSITSFADAASTSALLARTNPRVQASNCHLRRAQGPDLLSPKPRHSRLA